MFTNLATNTATLDKVFQTHNITCWFRNHKVQCPMIHKEKNDIKSIDGLLPHLLSKNWKLLALASILTSNSLIYAHDMQNFF